jgi:hypothetical protein
MPNVNPPKPDGEKPVEGPFRQTQFQSGKLPYHGLLRGFRGFKQQDAEKLSVFQ